MKSRRKSLVLGFLFILIGLGIGYAFLTTNLNINGIADIDSNTWDVYWDNVQVTDGSVAAEEPVIDTNKTSISFSTHLSQPGDYFDFTVDAINDGSIDAMISSVTTKINGTLVTTPPAYLEYEITYSDGETIQTNQLLASGKQETYKVHVGYKKDVSAEELPDSNTQIIFQIEILYEQADGNAEERPHYLYYVGNDNIYLNQSIIGTTTYTNYQDAINAYGDIYYAKFELNGTIVEKLYVCAAVDGKEYCILGSNPNAYFDNIEIMEELFGTSQCETPGNATYCSRADIRLRGYADENGHVEFGDKNPDGKFCYIYTYGQEKDSVRCSQ